MAHLIRQRASQLTFKNRDLVGCTKQYQLSSELMEVLGVYDQALRTAASFGEKATRLYWQNVTTDVDVRQRDQASNTRFLLGSAMYDALSLSNGTKPDTQKNLKNLALAEGLTGDTVNAPYEQSKRGLFSDSF